MGRAGRREPERGHCHQQSHTLCCMILGNSFSVPHRSSPAPYPHPFQPAHVRVVGVQDQSSSCLSSYTKGKATKTWKAAEL